MGNKLRNKLVFNKIQISRKLFNVHNIRDDDEEEEKQRNTRQQRSRTETTPKKILCNGKMVINER